MSKIDFTNEVPSDILVDFLTADADGVSLVLRVKPNCAKEKLTLSGMDGLVLCVRAQALENAANERVKAILAQLFSLPRSRVNITSGHRSRIKKILLAGCTIEQLKHHLLR